MSVPLRVALWVGLLVQFGAPLPQTPFQQARFAEVHQRAAAASAAAGPELLAELDQPDLRRQLTAVCPSFAGANANDLLATLRQYHRAAEVVSGFHTGGPGAFSWDMSVDEGRRSTWFENQWEVRLRNHGSFLGGRGWFAIQDDVETGLYGLRPFGRRAVPQSPEEAAERGIYTSLNAVGADMGATLYGDLSAVFAPEDLQDVLLLSAVDTGAWTALCNQTLFPGWPPQVYRTKCDAYNFTLGTLDHFDHLVLANLRYWRREPSQLLARQLGRMCPQPLSKNLVHSSELFQYWEGIPAARIPLATLKLVVANFPAAFGTKGGRVLQQWCRERGWVLAWSLGLNTGSLPDYFGVGLQYREFEQVGRLLDPTVLSSTTVNVSYTNDTTTAFDRLWDVVHFRRSVWKVSNTTWAGFWNDVQVQLPAALRVAALRPGQCADARRCVGLAGHGHCVCYR